jgi:hypothetical protein
MNDLFVYTKGQLMGPGGSPSSSPRSLTSCASGGSAGMVKQMERTGSPMMDEVIAFGGIADPSNCGRRSSSRIRAA